MRSIRSFIVGFAWSVACLTAPSVFAADPNPQQFEIAIGDTVSEDRPGPGAGKLEEVGATDVYTFLGQAGQTVYFDELTGHGCEGTLRWRLTDPEGGVIFDQRFAGTDACASGPDAGRLALASTGTFTLTVSASGGWTGAYSFRLVRIFDRSFGLILDQVVTNAIAVPGLIDTYVFSGMAGRKLFFDELTGNGCVGWLRWTLRDSAGAVLFDQRFAAAEGCASGPDAGTVTLPRSDTYFLSLYALNDWLEEYSFRVVPVQDRQEPVVLGTVVTNTLQTVGATDTYTFQGVAGQKLYFDELTGHGCFGSLRWALRDPDGVVLFDQRFAGLDACASGPDAGTVILPKSGAYSLRIFGLNDWVEGYSFQIVPVLDQSQPVALGEVVTNALQTVGATDTYTFPGVAGQKLYFDELTGHGCFGSLRWALRDPDGVALFDQRFAGLDACASGPDAGTVILPKSGGYLLSVFGLNDWVEGYSFQIVPVLDQSQPVVLGTVVTNTLQTVGATNTHTFQGVVGQKLYFDELTGHGCFGSLRWALRDPDGVALFDQRFAGFDACASGPDAGTVILPKSGAYSLRVFGLNDWVEGYSFQIVPILDQSQSVALGEVVTNALQTVGATDTYTFPGVAGQKLYFDELTGHGCFGSLRWTLADPDGEVLFDQRFAGMDACASGPDAGRMVLPKTGAYSLRVFALNDWVEGYSFRVVPVLDEERAVEIGNVITNALATPGAIHRYTLTGAAGQKLYFDELTGHGCFGSLRWALRDPEGVALFDQRFAGFDACASGPDAGEVIFAMSGAYVLEIAALNDWIEGYSFAVWPVAEPIITPIANRVIAAGDRLAVAVVARPTSPQGNPLQYSVAAGPPGAVISNEGIFSWTAPADAVGDFPVLLRVRDAFGGVSETGFSIRVLFAPDLAVSRLLASPEVETDSASSVAFRESNAGTRPAVGPWTTQLWLSADEILDAGDEFIGAYPFTGALPPGQFIERSVPIRWPKQPGSYRIIAITDAENAVIEGDEGNNAAVSPAISVLASYSATVSAATESALAGSPIALTGEARRRSGAVAAFEVVNVFIKVRETTRVLSALTDGMGRFSLTFRPLLTEAGNYTVGAAHPGELDAPVQDTFRLLGMTFSPREVDLRMTSSSAAQVSGLLMNRGQTALTGLRAELAEPLPASLSAEFTLPNSIAGDGSAAVEVKVASSTDEGFSGPVFVEVTSAEGARARLQVNLLVAPKQPYLSAAPGSLSAGMVRGHQTVVTFQLRNEGGLATGPVNLLLPDLPWLSAAYALPLPPIAPGAGAEVTLLLQPPADLPLGEHRGTIVATDGAVGVNVPFDFNALSEGVGDLLVEVVDEYTFYAEGAPRVAGAKVILREHRSLTEVTNKVADAAGRAVFTRLKEGYYDLEVSADKHSTFRGALLVQAGASNEIQPFLTRETIRYEFSVVPTEIEDRTRVVIETVFETFVPIPVVTIEPNQIDLADIQADRTEIELKITNHGLIAAQDYRLSFNSNSRWRFTPLATELGDLPARSSITVPLVIERLSGAPTAASATETALASLATEAHPLRIASQSVGRAAANDDCGLGGGGCYTIICGTNKNTYCTPVYIPLVCGGEGLGGPYLPPPTFGLGGAGSYYPPTCECTPLNCDPCAGPLAQALLDCAIGFLPIPDFAGCLKDGKGLADSVSDCYHQLQTNGPPCDLGAGGVAAGSYVVSCLKALGKEVPYVGEILSGIDCYLKIKKAQEDCSGGAPSGGSGARLARANRLPHNEIGSFFPGTQAVLEQGRRLEAIAGVFTAILGDPTWLHPGQGTNFNVFISNFADAIAAASPGGLRVTDAERAALLAGPHPDLVSDAQVNAFVNRWNRTLDYNARGIYLTSQVPVGESADFLALDTMQAALTAAAAAFEANEAEGFVGDPLSGLRFALGRLRQNLAEGGGGVCARVRVRLDQEAVTTREAFKATLELENASDEALLGIQVELQIFGPDGQRADSLFGQLPPELSGLSAIDGSGQVAAKSTGQVSWLLVPSHSAAPSPEARNYFVGGYFTYTEDGVPIRVPLTPAPITVHPTPRLTLTYFHERDVRSDDPFTDQLEPTIPYSLAVMAKNTGWGAARQVRIVSSEPQIIENEKGLLIDFDLIATEVAGEELTPSLTADFGDLDPGELKMARWLFTSSLQGQFIEYSATFENIGPLKDFPELATVEAVSIHELIHIVRAQGVGVFDDGQPDFLVNDIPDDDFRPDTLYLSDGTTNAVAAVTSGTFDGSPSAADLEVQLTVTTTAGWTYVNLIDPGGAQFRLARVLRSDGSEVREGDNVWTTDRTFIAGGRRPRYEHRLHLFDRTAAGSTQYRLQYEPATPIDLNAPTSRVLALAGSSGPEVPVRWTGSDLGGSGLAYFDIYVAIDRGPFVPWLERTALTGAIYSGETGRHYAFVSAATDGAGNREVLRASADAETVVNRVNSRPRLLLPAIATVTEGATVAFRARAEDDDAPADQFTFALGADAPPGLTIDAATGRVSWRTGEGNGPSTNRFTVIVTDNGIPPLSASGQAEVVVAEENSAPVVGAIADRVINEDQLLEVTVEAEDFDLPAQRLTHRLAASAPLGMTIGQASGVLRWRPTAVQGPSTNRVEVHVTDGQATTTAAFTVVVRDSAPDFEVSLGSAEVEAGDSGSVPLRVKSSLDLAELVFALKADDERLTLLGLEPLTTLIANGSLAPMGEGQYEIRLTAPLGQSLPADAELAHLEFASSLGASEFISLAVSDLRGTRLTGAELTSPRAIDGRVLIRGPQPILEISRSSGALTVRGNPGETLILEHLADLSPGSTWQTVREIPLVEPTVILDRAQLPEGPGFLRARIE